jgi:hypothetical protein
MKTIDRLLRFNVGIAVAAPLVFLNMGCTSAKRSQPVTGIKPSQQTAVTSVAYTKGDDLRRVRTPEFVKSYHVGRSTTRTGDLMREAHQVYRLEKSGRWNLARSNPPLDANAPVTRVVDQSFKPLPEDKQIRAEVARQQDLTREIEVAKGQLITAIAEAKERLDREPLQLMQIAELQEEIARLRGQLDAAESVNEQAEPGDIDTENDPPQSEKLKEWGERQPSQ